MYLQAVGKDGGDQTPFRPLFGPAARGPTTAPPALPTGGRQGVDLRSVHGDKTNKQAAPWTDIYALGAVAYFAISGHVPPKAPDRLRIDRLPPVADAAPRLHPGLAAAVDAALAVQEADRPQSIAQWRMMLDGTVAPVPPREDSVPPAMTDWTTSPAWRGSWAGARNATCG